MKVTVGPRPSKDVEMEPKRKKVTVHEFVRGVLQWKIGDLEADQTGERNDDLNDLPSTFQSVEHYFSCYKPFILQECKASLVQGLGRRKSKTSGVVSSVKAIDKGIVKVTFQIDQSKAIVRANTVVVVTLPDQSEAVAFITEGNVGGDMEADLLVCVPETLRDKIKGIATVDFTTLSSVTMSQRAYEACSANSLDFGSPLARELVTGREVVPPTSTNMDTGLQWWQRLSADALPERVANKLSHLNTEQRTAAEKFIRKEEGITLIQGPPGTGKTTLIVAVLAALMNPTHPMRIMVCAPSNKAVQELCSRFCKDHPSISTVLVGVGEKISREDDVLRAVFANTWATKVSQKLKAVANDLKTCTEQDGRKARALQMELSKVINAVMLRAPKLYQKSVEKSWSKLSSAAPSSRTPSKVAGVASKIAKDLDKEAKIGRGRPVVAQLMQSACVIFSTLAVAGRSTMSSLEGIQALIVDEAAQSVEADVFIPLQVQPRRTLLVGDHHQLPATVTSELAARKGFGKSMMMRLHADCQFPCVMLQTQYRMAPSIRRLASKLFYEQRLRDDESVKGKKRRLPWGDDLAVLGPLTFVDVKGPERSRGHSFDNQYEAGMVVSLAGLLVRNGVPPADIGIISLYSAQVDLIRGKLARERLGNITLNTVDGFQGCEKDVMLISFVRSNERGNIGFVKEFRRLNVAITRSRFSCILVGDIETLSGDTECVARVIEHIRDNDSVYAERDVRRLCDEMKDHRSPKPLDARTRERNAKKSKKSKKSKKKQKKKKNKSRMLLNQSSTSGTSSSVSESSSGVKKRSKKAKKSKKSKKKSPEQSRRGPERSRSRSRAGDRGRSAGRPHPARSRSRERDNATTASRGRDRGRDRATGGEGRPSRRSSRERDSRAHTRRHSRSRSREMGKERSRRPHRRSRSRSRD